MLLIKALLLSLCSFSVFSGSVCNSKGWVVGWSFPDSLHIDFSLSLTSETLESFGWAGIGFKYSSDGEGMISADIANIIFSELPTDRFAESNRLPKLDTDLGGTLDIISPTYDPELMQYTWRRALNSGDIYDQIYQKDAEMQLLWACGLMSDGTQIKHFKKNRGIIDIVLSDDFTSGCSDIEPLN